MRILVLYASAGTGHRRAAEALAAAAACDGADDQVTVCDILDFTPLPFRQTYARGYLRLVRKAPELWSYFYSRTDRNAQVPWRKWVRSVFNEINAHSFFRFARDLAPDCIICTHFLPLELISSRSRRRKMVVPFFACVTDFAVHSLWMSEEVDCYYVATQEARRQLIRRGQPHDRIAVTGIPIDPAFSRARSRKLLKQGLEIEPGLPVVLALFGGLGVGPVTQLVRSLHTSEIACRLLLVAGAEESFRKEAVAAARGARMPITVYGFVNNVHELMRVSDIVVGKPGGLTCSEALAVGAPMLIIDPIPGQEQRNCEFLLEAGAAARLLEIEDAADKIDALLRDQCRLKRMGRNARRIGRPCAASARRHAKRGGA